ncbi:hypothetical protein EMIT053CA3_200092 [Pseudomonas donghuensis]
MGRHFLLPFLEHWLVRLQVRGPHSDQPKMESGVMN